MAIEITTDTWQDFKYEALDKIDDCHAVTTLLDEVVGDISSDLFVAEMKIKNGEGADVDSIWFANASKALTFAKRKRKMVGDILVRLQKAKNAVLAAEEKDRTDRIIVLLESISSSLLKLVTK